MELDLENIMMNSQESKTNIKGLQEETNISSLPSQNSCESLESSLSQMIREETKGRNAGGLQFSGDNPVESISFVDNNKIFIKKPTNLKKHVRTKSYPTLDFTPETSETSVNEFIGEPFDACNEQEKQKPHSCSEFSFCDYLCAEISRGYILENNEAKFTAKRERVLTFMKIPRELEKFMLFGFFQCVDAFLYVFTFLPIRLVLALLKLFINGLGSVIFPHQGRILEPAQICDLVKGGVLFSCCILMSYVDLSMMYHLIRGQAIIKLYIFFNMLEVADRLFSSFGQDIMDSLLWTATENKERKRQHFGVLPHLLLATGYVFTHALLVMFQATTLNVAFNSHNKALLTIMMSNNFVELKGSVFKKFEKNNLFQMSCSDVRERFHFMILLSIVCVRNLTEFSWNVDHLWVLVPDVVMVMLSEVVVDCVKHAFITKFNNISAEVYHEYTTSLAYDMTESRQTKSYSDYMDVVSRRMGFIPLPLAAVLVRIISQSFSITTRIDVFIFVLAFLCVFSFKALNNIILLGKACGYVKIKKELVKKQKAESSIIDEKEHLIRRSKSLASNMQDLVTPVVGQYHPRVLLSNSSVNLHSNCFNEQFLADSKLPQEGSNIKQRKSSKPPLEDIDRFTMCSSQII